MYYINTMMIFIFCEFVCGGVNYLVGGHVEHNNQIKVDQIRIVTS